MNKLLLFVKSIILPQKKKNILPQYIPFAIFHVQWNLVGTEIGWDDVATSFKI